MTSCNTGDIEHRYCGRCDQFYDEMLEVSATIRSPRMDKVRKQVADLVHGAAERVQFRRSRYQSTQGDSPRRPEG